MRRSTPATLTILLCLAALLPACAFKHRQVNELADGLRTTSPETTLIALSSLQVPGRDQGQYLLDLGTLKLLTGDFEGSIETLQSAKETLKNLQAISISENLGAATINETLRAYAGTPGERVLVQEILALAYLLKGDLEGARVEALQADVLMNQLADKQQLRGQLASARFVSGLIFELGGEWDDAMISYRKAAGIMERRGQALPAGLKDSLLRISLQQGLNEEHLGYVARYGYQPPALGPAQGELIVIYWDGIVTRKRQHFISVYVPELEHHVSLALPYYPPSTYRPGHVNVGVSGTAHRTETLEDIETLARQALEAQRAEIYAMALARMVSKHQAISAAQKENPYAGMAINLASIFSEIADTRSWNMLPSTIQIARIAVPAGQWTIEVPGRAGNAATSQSVQVAAGQQVVLLVPQVSQRVFSYHSKS